MKITNNTPSNDPMALIVFYNGLADKVIEWRNYKQGDKPPYQTMEELDYEDSNIYEMIWMYCVLCFGNYGTSPRSGWIEDFDGFHKWIDEVEELEVPL